MKYSGSPKCVPQWNMWWQRICLSNCGLGCIAAQRSLPFDHLQGPHRGPNLLVYAMIFFRVPEFKLRRAVSDCCDYSQCFWEQHKLVLLFTGDIASYSALLREICSTGPGSPVPWCPEFCRVTSMVLRLWNTGLIVAETTAYWLECAPFKRSLKMFNHYGFGG